MDGAGIGDLMCGFTAEQRRAIGRMGDEEARSFCVGLLRRAGLPWPRVARVMGCTIAETRREGAAFPWPFPAI